MTLLYSIQMIHHKFLSINHRSISPILHQCKLMLRCTLGKVEVLHRKDNLARCHLRTQDNLDRCLHHTTLKCNLDLQVVGTLSKFQWEVRLKECHLKVIHRCKDSSHLKDIQCNNLHLDIVDINLRIDD
jgi:hypothetical protein